MLHETLRRRISNELALGRMPGSVIFEGPKGVGKKTLARETAAALHCEGEKKPCGVCPSCAKHKTGNHPDYFELLPEKGKKTVSVASVREACEELFIRPIISDKKILFVPEAGLCEAAAQNAMLKCFEEPPEYAVIILAVNDLSLLLDTIKSRAAIYTVNPEPEEAVISFLREHYPEKAAESSFIAAFSGGIIGRAKDLVEDSTLSEKRRTLLSLLSAFSKSRYNALKTADFLTAEPENEEFFYELFLSFFRDAAAIKCGSEKIINKDFLTDIKKFSSEAEKGALVRALSETASAKNDKSKNANYSLFITDLVLRLWEVLHD